MTATTAISQLERAFEERRVTGTAPTVGLFGEGFPEALLRAAGFSIDCLHLCPPAGSGEESDTPAIDPYIEPFVDPQVRRFLHRLSHGAFADLTAIVFSRDDSSALVAYQYARELGRMGLAPSGPPLFLWNLVHSPGPDVARFNTIQAEDLWRTLDATPPAPEAVAAAVEDDRRRATALEALVAAQRADPSRLSGEAAMRWRIAGRWMPPATHAALLEEAIADGAPAGRARPRLGLVGGRLDSPEAYRRIEAGGALVCDLQPLVAAWPVPLPAPAAGPATRDAVLAAAAGDAACPRIVPSSAHADGLFAALTGARCDAVLSVVPPNDDVFGWDVPGLKRRLAAVGVPLIDLGFVDVTPDEEALGGISARLSKALDGEVAP